MVVGRAFTSALPFLWSLNWRFCDLDRFYRAFVGMPTLVLEIVPY